MIIPGSHKRFVSCVGAPPEGYHRESLVSYRPPFGTPEETDVTALADELGIDTVVGDEGSALFPSEAPQAADLCHVPRRRRSRSPRRPVSAP